jgi:hypothetical protein
MPFDWNKFRDGERFKFVNPGDAIEGEILSITTTTFGGTADPTPVITLKKTDGKITEVTASQTVLCSRLAEEGPDIGDFLSMTFTGVADNAKPGRSPAKLFDVIVKREGEVPPTSASEPAAADEANDPF